MDIPVKTHQNEQKSSTSKGLLNTSLQDLWQKRFLEPFNWRIPMESSLMEMEEGDFLPRADYFETDKDLKIRMDVPNVDPDDLSIEVDDHNLFISGHTEHEEHEEGETWYRAERAWGNFKRIFNLPNNLDLEHIQAESHNGTVSIQIPKKKSIPKKRISIAKK